MSRARKIEPFFIIVVDSDQEKFNVLGPMSDDTQIIQRVIRCQDQQRNVRCHTPGAGQSRDQIIASYSRQYNQEYTDEPIAAE